MALDQTNRQIALFSPFGDEVTDLALHSFTACEEISRLFEINAELLSENFALQFNEILGQKVSIRLNTHQAGSRFFNGHVRAFRFAGTSGGLAQYQAVIVPKLWFLTRSADCRIFQNLTIPDIIRKVLEPYGMSPLFEDTLTGDYEQWDFCVQYRETDFNFISRLMEQEGIHYYFTHTKTDHTLVLGDGASVHQPFSEEYKAVPFEPYGERAATKQGVRSWVLSRQIQPGRYVLNDYDFERPKVPLVAPANAAGDLGFQEASHEIFDYPGEYTKFDDGERYARMRIEELQTQFEVAQGHGDVRGLAAGAVFDLLNAPYRSDSANYLVVLTTIQASSESFFTETEGGGGAAFSCSFTAIPSKVTFRPARLTPKPVIQGTQTAVVTGPSGEEIHTDKHGRIKVHFHWDREGPRDQNSSCWIRVSQTWAGKGWGSSTIPRIGQEVIVAFLEGDPDQPLVVGNVYNGDQTPPYASSKGIVSGLKSDTHKGQGYNEMSMDDTAGKEKITIHGQYDMNTTVEHDETISVGNDRTETVTKNENYRIGEDRKETVVGNRHLVVKAEKKEKVESNKHVHVTGDHNEKVDGTVSLQAANIHEKSKTLHALDAEQEIHVKAGMKLVLEAGMEVTLKAGASFIKLDPSGLTIFGAPQTLINSGGSPGQGSGCSPTDPADPEEAAGG